MIRNANAAAAEDEILTTHEAAIFLKVSDRTLQSLMKSDGLPFGKVGVQYRFVRSDLLDWLREKGGNRRNSNGAQSKDD